MASTYDEELDYYDEFGPVGSDETDYWPTVEEPEVRFPIPVRTGSGYIPFEQGAFFPEYREPIGPADWQPSPVEMPPELMALDRLLQERRRAEQESFESGLPPGWQAVQGAAPPPQGLPEPEDAAPPPWWYRQFQENQPTPYKPFSAMDAELASSLERGGPGLPAIPEEFRSLVDPQKVAPLDLNKGLVEFSKLAVDPQTWADALTYLASASPELTQEEAENLIESRPTPGALEETLSGVHESVLGGMESMTSPAMIAATAAMGGAPAPLARVGSAAFLGDMLSHAPETFRRLGEASVTGNHREMAKAAADAAQLAVFTPAAGAHAFGPRGVGPELGQEVRAQTKTMVDEVERRLGRNLTDLERYAIQTQQAGKVHGFSDNPRVRAIEEELNRPLTQGERNALQESFTAEADGRLPQQPRPDEALPAQEGGGEIPPGNLPPGDTSRALTAEETRRREVSLSQGEIPTDPVERANWEQDLFSTGAEKNQALGMNGNWRVATPEESVGNWRASVDEADGTVVLNLEKVRNWLGKLKPEQRVRAVQAMFLEEGIHGIALKEFTKSDVVDLWGRLTEAERRLVEKSYGKIGPDDVPAGWSREAMYGHEYLRRQMGRMLREPVREKAEAKGYQWLKESAIDAIERVILAARRTMDRFRKDPTTSKRLDAMLTRMEEHIDKAREVKGMEPVDWEARLAGAPAAAAAAGAPRAMEPIPGSLTEAERAARLIARPDLFPEEPPPAAGALAKPEIAKTVTSRFNNKLGDPIGTTYHATPEDWAQWQKVKATIDDLLKSGGAEAMGTPEFQQLFKANETIKNKYGGMPPEPPKGELGPKAMGKEEGEPEFRPRRADEHPADYETAKREFLRERGQLPDETEVMLKDEIRALRRALAQKPTAERRQQMEAQLAEAQTDLRNFRAGRGAGLGPRALSQSQQRRAQEDRHSMVNRAREFFGGLPARLRALPYRLQGREAPMTYSKAPESANKLVEHASAQVAAPEVARAMASEVLGDKWKDTDFGQRLGAVLVEDRLRGMRAEMRRNRDPGWRNVVSIVGHPNSPFRVEADFRRALNDPEIRAAIDRHKQTVQRMARAQHQLARGDLAGHGLHTDAFVNLEAVLPDVAEHFGGGGRGNLMNPLRHKSRFSKKAKGTAEEYHLDYRRLSERMIEANFNEATKRRMYGQLIQDGLAVMTKPGEAPPPGFNAHPQPFTIERKGTPAGGGKAQTFVRRLWVNKDIYPEVRQALNVDGRIGESALVNAFNGLNQIQLAGPTDAAWHIANMVASIAGSQGGRNVFVDLGRKFPGLNLMDALGRTAVSAIKVLRDSPEIQKQIGELARIGAMRPQEGRGIVPLGEKYAKLRLLHPGNMIQLLDRAGRLVRDDLYKNMVRRGLVEDTVANRRLWVNQMGQYNARLMGGIMRWMKEQGVSPFVVAGTNFNRMAMRRMALSQGLKAKNPAAWAQMKAVDAFGVLATLVVVPSVLNYLLTSNPSGRPGTKFGQIDTGQDTKDGKHLVIDPGQWTGLRRGMRITGTQALIEGMREGQRGKRIGTRMAGDILGGAIHPWTGPAVHGVSVAATGYSPSGYQESENPKDVGANLKAMAKQLNPLFKAAIEGHEERRGVGAQLALSLGGAVGVKAVRPLTAYDRMRNIHEKWLADNPDRRIRESFERNEAATFPLSQYRDLDKFIRNKDKEGMMEALQKVREVALDKDILKRMLPVIGTGINIQPKPLFHESAQSEAQFRLSLTPEQLEEYQRALEDRKENFQRFLEVWRERGPRPEVIEQQTAPAAR